MTRTVAFALESSETTFDSGRLVAINASNAFVQVGLGISLCDSASSCQRECSNPSSIAFLQSSFLDCGIRGAAVKDGR